jgi:hypothetical protein
VEVLQMIPVYLAALSTEVFIIYAIIASFTLRSSFDLFTILTTTIWMSYLVLPTLGAIYAGAVTSEEVSA